MCACVQGVPIYLFCKKPSLDCGHVSGQPVEVVSVVCGINMGEVVTARVVECWAHVSGREGRVP